MAKILKMKFKTAEGKTSILSLRHAREGIPDAEVRDAMKTISEANIYEKDGVDLYVKPIAAYYSETTTDQVFDDSKEANEDLA